VKIKNTGDLNEEKWNSLLEHAPHSTVYHTKTWSEVWEKSYPGSHSFFLICVDEKGDYLAGFPVWQRERFGLKRDSIPSHSVTFLLGYIAINRSIPQHSM